ncbi:MAG: sodium-translocating pyrophosphatase [Candidatus Methanomethylophilaceae archaeon]|nr:sodium-translocating pyrophosphatase [Candidatus Methanomethylophilaceae archaeon]
MIEITTVENLLFMIPVAVVIALIFALYFLTDIRSRDKGTPEMQKISDAIETGAMAYLRRQYKTIAIISIIVAIVIALAGIPESTRNYLGYPVAIAFLIGAGFSILSGFIGMKVSVSTNIKTASAARESLASAFKTAFRGGAVSGIVVSTLSILGLFAVFLAYNAIYEEMTQTLHYIVGYAFGASFAALFAQLGGGIYTKAADVGADLVGKVEAGIPEDDPRNPAVIADLVGDNVGDCAGRGADIFESTAAEIIGSMVIGLAVLKIAGMASLSNNWIFLPMVIMAFGLIASLVGILTVRLKESDKEVFSALNRGYYITMALVIAGTIFSVYWLLKDEASNWMYFAGCGVVGIVLALAIVYITQYYTGDHGPVKSIADASKTGPATNVIKGISVGMESTLLPVICISIAICATFVLGYYADPTGSHGMVFGLYGTAVGTIAMLASSAFILAEDTYGPITDNAGGIVEMSDQPAEVRERTDKLDASGNTTKALTKGYAMASASLAAFLLFAAYFEIVGEIKGISLIKAMHVDLGNPLIFVGGLIGAVLVFYFASLAISAVGKAAGEMIEEVRRQFREDPGIMEGSSDPDYASCVDIATRGALRQMVLPALLPIIVPIMFGLLFKWVLPDELASEAPAAVGALIMVATIVGVLLANFLNNGGGAWDNAKKFIEAGSHGGKGSTAHAAAVVGDTVGDPFKDTAGPSIHVLIKLLSTICLVTAVLFV